MGNFIAYYTGLTWFSSGFGQLENDDFTYAVYDPTQLIKPADRTKDIISVKHQSSPLTLDKVKHHGCDTIWKCFKRSVWKNPTAPFLGVRSQINRGYLDQRKIEHGQYNWLTYEEVDAKAENLANSLAKRAMCPVSESKVEGTPDLKFMAIFSENRPEWFISELACASASITIVPIAVEVQFLNEDRIVEIFSKTEVETICVSKSTIGTILDLKSKEKLP